MRRFLPGAISCSSCSGDRAAKNLSIRSALDFQTLRAESIIRVSEDSFTCMAQSFLSCLLSAISAARRSHRLRPGSKSREKRAAGTCALRRRVPLEKSNQRPLAMLDVGYHLNDAGIFVELVWDRLPIGALSPSTRRFFCDV